MGQWHGPYSEYQAHFDDFIPEDPSGDDTWLREYIDHLLTSPDEPIWPGLELSLTWWVMKPRKIISTL